MLLLLSTIIIGMSRWFVSEEDGCRKGDLDLMAYLLALLLLCATYARDEVCQVMESVDRLKINHNPIPRAVPALRIADEVPRQQGKRP